MRFAFTLKINKYHYMITSRNFNGIHTVNDYRKKITALVLWAQFKNENKLNVINSYSIENC